jgi:hypothetical protein
VSLTVTVTDNETGDVQTGHVADGDYALVTASPCRLDGIQTYPAKGTIVLTIRGWTNKGKPQPSPELEAKP